MYIKRWIGTMGKHRHLSKGVPVTITINGYLDDVQSIDIDIQCTYEGPSHMYITVYYRCGRVLIPPMYSSLETS